MIKSHLSKEDVQALAVSLKKAFESIRSQKETESIARYIQFPKIPSILSESLVTQLIRDKKILPEIFFRDITINHSKADIIINTPEKEILVEVKSTGERAFQLLGKKDIGADYLIWVHFNSFFNKADGDEFEVYILNNPSRYFSHAVKITLPKFKKTALDLTRETFSFKEI